MGPLPTHTSPKMLARRFASVARTSSRTFTTSALVKKDFVQDLYLRELKAYKPKEVAANAHVGQVKEFHSPSAPKAPAVASPTTAASTEADSDATEGQTADEYLSFVE